jgi:hypothetical protein
VIAWNQKKNIFKLLLLLFIDHLSLLLEDQNNVFVWLAIGGVASVSRTDDHRFESRRGIRFKVFLHCSAIDYNLIVCIRLKNGADWIGEVPTFHF